MKYIKELLLRYIKEGSLHGLKMLLYPTSIRFSRALWFILMLIIFVWSNYIITHLTLAYFQQPVEIRMSPNKQPVSTITFPVVGICPANKISKKKLLAFSKRLFDIQQEYKPNLLESTPEKLAEHVVFLGVYYLFPLWSVGYNLNSIRRLHTLLFRIKNSTQYSIEDILYELSPDCEEYVAGAEINGRSIDILQYLHKRTTSAGVCCFSNYARQSTAFNITKRNFENKFAEFQKVRFKDNYLTSITYYLQEYDDYALRELFNNAFEIKLGFWKEYFNIQTYVSSIIANINTTVSVALRPAVISASRNIEKITPMMRFCYFSHEGKSLLNYSFYSYDECLLHCRMQHMVNNCGCVNAGMPGMLINAPECTLGDIKCILNWQRNWYRPIIEEHSSSRCAECLPPCDWVKYETFVTETINRPKNTIYKGNLIKLNIFFDNMWASVTTTDTVASSTVLLNRFGGILSLMFGFSVICLVELLYILSGRGTGLVQHVWLQVKQKRKTYKTEIMMPALYWKEMQHKRNNNTTLNYNFSNKI